MIIIISNAVMNVDIREHRPQISSDV